MTSFPPIKLSSRPPFAMGATAPAWEPAVNVYRCSDHFAVCLDLAGLDQSSVQITVTPHRLVVCGTRPPVQPSSDATPQQVLAMEIDHGRFERCLELPLPVTTAGVHVEQLTGLLWIRLPLRKK